ncbi:MAG: DUF4034 domain-containing protein [Comamonadaceae bacterium]|nr:MAG: DUF4034 domain-containing protein [Comamonadaceae bacterium]
MRALILAACFWLAVAPLHAGELEDRKAISDQIAADLERSDFAAIEKRYAQALAGETRLASGIFVANRIARTLLSGVWKAAPTGVKLAHGQDELWNPVEEKLQRWAAQFPRSALPAIALSNAYTAHGWAYRGNGMADTVAKEDWVKLEHYLGKAQEALVSRREAGEKDPNWWREMIEMARVRGWPGEQFNAVSVKAMDAFPGHYDIYFEIGLALLPKWGGSMEQVAAFMDDAVRRTRQTEGESLYGRIYWSLTGNMTEREKRHPLLPWSKVRAGLNDVVQRYPDSWNMNSFARMACEAGDKPTAFSLLARIEGSVVEPAWHSRAQLQRCRNWAAE